VGLYGEATATTGATRGLIARAASTSGIGAWGYAFATSGATTGVRGDVWSPTGVAGVFNTVNANGKILSGRVNGVEKFSVNGSGSVTAASFSGTFGGTWSGGFSTYVLTGTAVIGQSGYGNGIYGISSSGTAIYGVSTSGNGVYGVTSSANYPAVAGSAPSGGEGFQGLSGTASASWGNPAGVYGQCETSSVCGGVLGVSSSGVGVWGSSLGNTGYPHYAGYFSGNVNVAGSLYKSADYFKIDHPMDPANKYLLHSVVESPDMKNVYDGVVRLDSTGEAWVDLPEWFQALNSDFRYQLTSIGRPQPNLYIAEEISGNRFRIAGGSPGGKVSWQVTGIRQDAYAKAHRMQVEEEKPAAEKGFYRHPELYGQPEAKGIEWARRPK
jgi:hypothetical protein